MGGGRAIFEKQFFNVLMFLPLLMVMKSYECEPAQHKHIFLMSKCGSTSIRFCLSPTWYEQTLAQLHMRELHIDIPATNFSLK